ncbi:MAG: FAD-dependent oxidoreductase [Anaerolineales bacterium]
MSNQNKSIIVIGAGMAGLSAALDLHRAGYQVTVLEARERVGGRVYSIRTFSNGLVAEGGGEYIDSHHVRMLALAKEFGLSLGEVGSWQGQSGDWGAFENKAGLLSDQELWKTDLNTEYGKMWQALATLGKFVEDPHNPQASSKARELDQQTALDWINQQAVHPLGRTMFIQHIRSEYTCEPENFSLLDLARNASLYYQDPNQWPITYRIIGGNDLLPQSIAKQIPDIRLNAIVTSLRVQSEKTIVTYKQGDSYHTIESDFAILAIPLTTARHIDFQSSLSPAHQKMVNEVTYGAVTKVLIEYRKKFWLEKNWNGRLFTDGPVVLTWDATSHIQSEHGILTAYTGGLPGATLTKLSDAERIQTAVSFIEKLFPGSQDLIENTATIAWRNEAFSQCSYMALAPGEVTTHWKSLFTSAGRLYFAGEHATAIQGFMEGAVESGQRAAKNIMEYV